MAGIKGKSGGARPGAGRKRKPPEFLSDIVTSDPLDYLQAVIAHPRTSAQLKLKAAAIALPYLWEKIP